MYNLFMRKLAIPLLLALPLTACWSSKQQLYTNVVNQSSLPLEAIEVQYPGGSYGITVLKPGEASRKWVFVTPPCTYTLKFEDEKGTQYQSKPIDLGKDKCPREVVLTIDSNMNVSGAPK
jgi:hypothetical protein